MRSFQQKRKWRNLMQSRPVLVFLGGLLLFFTWGVIGFMGKMQTTRENRKMAENKVAELRKEKENLSLDIENLKTEDGKERIFRENFGLAKEGEGLIVVVEDKNAEENKGDESGGFLPFFKNLFKPRP
ncbi:hypothetical protein A2814_03360 [Candidatus Nomurabacteria bacterium RIFCSPHIGHO2_01_FULL_38_19]|uniref:Septum formation initiator n=1 Tax=Candidatus Nomurabacteria bacterium RIFCSPHIGHO2_01_FULL_38_19 TaxID=1801732 RepID=A0A1F6UQ90_9BACT|nr:MAG: hypothetical protein A2814_03360 [Candidatus Nomurabacteria bacterium RIFCSPHIGHO2_01_FULL_38_19]